MATLEPARDRTANGPYRDMTDLGRRVTLTQPQLENLATAGAFDSRGLDRRQAIFQRIKHGVYRFSDARPRPR